MKNQDINIRDPFVLVHEGKYYMYGTRAKNFGCKTGGFDVYIGTDLENWSEPKQVFDSEKQGFNSQVNWAPEVHMVDGSFYMFATFTKPDGLRGTYILKSDTPDGEFLPHSKGSITPDGWECLDDTLYNEDGKLYCVFCHEHTQILNGTICYVQLSDDLTQAITEPIELFDAGSYLKRQANESCHNVTDGPFFYRMENGRLLMIWSTSTGKYVQCIATSDNGSVTGKWSHLKPLFEEDGGHGMIFKDLNNKLRLTLHCPNDTEYEKPVFYDLKETEDTLVIAEKI